VIALQFQLSADYFLGMRKRGKPQSSGGLLVAQWTLFVIGAAVLTTSCSERERLTFPTAPDPNDGIGPVTTIDQPNGADTTVSAGPIFFVNGRSIDPDGVDSVYFFVIGGSDNTPPLSPSPPADTVTFGLPITTSGHAGDTIEVFIHGVDLRGNSGPSASRRVAVQ
jgi:hypothetical protein